MAGVETESRASRRLRITVAGTVQGVGFRPFVYRLAGQHGLSGWVRNVADGVLIEVEGDESALRIFAEVLRTDAPTLASVSDSTVVTIPAEGGTGFAIRESIEGADIRPIVPPDIATCPDCLSDMTSPANRRYAYPFTNCTNCGPRFTIIERIPYDRAGTTMSGFRMCPDCETEYRDPLDRRFHAQPNACPVCGPHLILDGVRSAEDREVVAQAADLLLAGSVLAIKGLGGFHLACDARSDEAVSALRTRKGRVGKPFALMCLDHIEARRICVVDAPSEALLLSPERPIVLMPARHGNGISHFVVEGSSDLGVMLPYTPLHHLLLSAGPPTLVMTSGNLSEEPIAHEDCDAARRLRHIADHILAHDRPIHVPCDDSVMRVFEDAPMPIRRARGFVPRPIDLGVEMPQILACGGDLKSTFCLTKGSLAVLSQHLGDLENAPTLDHYERMVAHFRRFFDCEPEVVAHDLHPDYHSTRYAESSGIARQIAVQHHHAHIASCMAENGLEGPVIGVAFDGTGYGADGRIWGGEFLVADSRDFRRAAHLQYVPLPGGDAAVRRPGRMALSYLLRACGPDVAVQLLTPEEVRVVAAQIERGVNCPLTSSMGRLFDAVSALLGVCREVTYEGQAAMELKAAASGPSEGVYRYDLSRDGGPIRVDVRPMIREIVEEVARGKQVAGISAKFHSTIADMTVRVCSALRDQTGLSRVAMSGGVFQNVLLLGMVAERLRKRGFEVLIHRLVPCNDGGLSLGQAVVAAGRCMR
ncbi:MAG: carbamoyltransferase HypF [Armatimonadetes bacterium]|nr:carbamoyltransferase HypF [Armatimonadota bacterium]